MSEQDETETDHWEKLRNRAIGVEMGDCDLCETFEADRVETVQNERTGEEMTVSLCQDCWEKTKQYQYDRDVSFSDEMRLREGES